MAFILGSFVVPPICFFIGSCIFITSFVNDILMMMHHLNVEDQTDGKNHEIKKHLSNIIDDISDVKQLSAICKVAIDPHLFFICFFQIGWWNQWNLSICHYDCLPMDSCKYFKHFNAIGLWSGMNSKYVNEYRFPNESRTIFFSSHFLQPRAQKTNWTHWSLFKHLF